MSQWLRNNRARIDADMQSLDERTYISPAFYVQYRAVPALMRQFLHGKVLDLGCGMMPFRACIPNSVSVYHGIDIQCHSSLIALIGDVQNLAMIADASYDSALCLEVLEHLPNPTQAIAEMARVLKPGGAVIISVPHLSRLHDLPHDYFRYTAYGLRHLLESNQLEVIQLQAKGGLFAFLGHQISSILLTLAWSVPGLRQIVWLLNRWLITLGCTVLDNMTGSAKTFPLGYLAVARKPIQSANQSEEFR
jgi:SAM-dependent methyltransferase